MYFEATTNKVVFTPSVIKLCGNQSSTREPIYAVQASIPEPELMLFRSNFLKYQEINNPMVQVYDYLQFIVKPVKHMWRGCSECRYPDIAILSLNFFLAGNILQSYGCCKSFNNSNFKEVTEVNQVFFPTEDSRVMVKVLCNYPELIYFVIMFYENCDQINAIVITKWLLVFAELVVFNIQMHPIPMYTHD